MKLREAWHAVSRYYLMEHAARGDCRAAEILKGLLLTDWSAEERPAEDCLVRVAIGVCTARRPKMLASCLRAIGEQIAPARVEIHIVVADNEPEPNNQRLVDEFKGRAPFLVHYVHEPRRGIPQARNAVLEKCRALDVDWIAFTDDDCWVGPGWLASHMEAARRYGADVVYGRRDLVFPLPAPFWAIPSDDGKFAEGQRLHYAATHNVLFSARLIGSGDLAGLQFDEQLPHGEDTDFFHRAVQHGARIVYSNEPIVFETVTPGRASLSYQASRAFYYAASRSYFHRRHCGVTVAAHKLGARCVLQGPVAVARLLAAPFVWPFSERAFKSLVLKAAVRLAGAAGAAAGMLGFLGNPYDIIDGY